MAEKRHQRLCPWIDRQILLAKRDSRSLLQKRLRRKLPQQRLIDHEVEARVTPRYGMTDAIAFARIEKENLARLSDRFVRSQVTDVDATIGKDEMRSTGMLLGALVPTAPEATHVTQRNARCLEQRVGSHFRACLQALALHSQIA